MTALADEVLEREAQQLPGLGGVVGALRRTHAGHLGAHEGPVGDVVVDEGRRRGVAGQLEVPPEERRAEIRCAQPLEVHGEERRVVDPVDVPQPVVELQAVERARPVREAEHVVGHQVAVPVDGAPAGDPLGEQRTTPVQEAQGQPLDRRGLGRVEEPVREGPHLLEAGEPP